MHTQITKADIAPKARMVRKNVQGVDVEVRKFGRNNSNLMKEMRHISQKVPAAIKIKIERELNDKYAAIFDEAEQRFKKELESHDIVLDIIYKEHDEAVEAIVKAPDLDEAVNNINAKITEANALVEEANAMEAALIEDITRRSTEMSAAFKPRMDAAIRGVVDTRNRQNAEADANETASIQEMIDRIKAIQNI